MSHESSNKFCDSPQGKSRLKSPNLMTRPFTATFTRLNVNSSDLRNVDSGEQKKFHLSNSHLICETFNNGP